MPGNPGYIPVRRGSFRFVSWYSGWPLNPESRATLQGSTFSPIVLTEGRVNWPLGGTEWIRLVNPEYPSAADNLLPDSGTNLLTILLHNAHLDPEHVPSFLPFVYFRSVMIDPGVDLRIVSWGIHASPTVPPCPEIATGYAPYRRVRVRFTAPVLPNTAQIDWRGNLPLTEMIPTGDLVADPPAADSADVRFWNSGVGIEPVDVVVRFD